MVGKISNRLPYDYHKAVCGAFDAFMWETLTPYRAASGKHMACRSFLPHFNRSSMEQGRNPISLPWGGLGQPQSHTSNPKSHEALGQCKTSGDFTNQTNVFVL